MRPPFLRILLLASSALAVQAAVQCARGQATLPEITVTPPQAGCSARISASSHRSADLDRIRRCLLPVERDAF